MSVAHTQSLTLRPAIEPAHGVAPSCGQARAVWFQLKPTVGGNCIHSLPWPSLTPACAALTAPTVALIATSKTAIAFVKNLQRDM